MDFRERKVNFQEAERRYAELVRQRDAGSISDEEFDAQRQQLMVQDEEGRWWAKSRKTGEWNYYDGSAWVRGIPPGYQPVAEGPPTESAPEHRPQPGQVEPSPSESQARGGVAEDGSRRRGAPSWVLVAGLVAVALVGVGAYLLRGGAAMATLPDVVGMSQDEAEEVLSSEGFDVKAETRGSSEDGEGKVVEQSPSGDEAEESSTVAITVGEGPSPGEKAPQPTPGYQMVENDSGNLSAEVPSEWGDRYTGYDGTFEGEDVDAGEGVGPAITASTDMNAWAAGGPVPGMYMLASRKLVREYDEDQLVDSSLSDLSSCDAGERQDFDRPPYLGKIQMWDCRGDGSTIFKLGAAPESRECAIVLQIKTYSEAEREAARHILDTFEADCERI